MTTHKTVLSEAYVANWIHGERLLLLITLLWSPAQMGPATRKGAHAHGYASGGPSGPQLHYPPQCPGRDAKRRRAGTIRVALNYAALLLAWLLCFLARCPWRTAIPSRTWAFLGLWEMKWTSFIIFIPSSENGQGDGERQEHGISGCWEGAEVICIHFFSPHSPGVCFQCGSSNDLVHQR